MKNFLKKSNAAAFLFLCICGTLLHFTYEWSGENKIVGMFSAVNESTWEHMKLLFFPSIVYFLPEYAKYRRQSDNLLTARTLGLLCGLAFIPVSFYTYSGIIGKSYIGIDIFIFIVSIMITLAVSSKKLQDHLRLTALAALLILLFLLALFIVFTFFTPHIALFLDPVRFTYGV